MKIVNTKGRRPTSPSLRGGAFDNQPSNVRTANRNRNQPTNRNNDIGFRAASTSRENGVWPGL
jgi:formylglycine-generating enzyme required for sulfatase activity